MTGPERSGGFARSGGRSASALRPVSIELDAMKFAEGSALVAFGDTRVLCSASVERRVPPFLVGKGRGWLTAEYAMLPRATLTRSMREVSRGRPSGRTSEIQRLIGRSLRSAVNLRKLPEVTIAIDCDVIQADGGTRTASVTGGYVAAVAALAKMLLEGDLKTWPLVHSVAAVSVGICEDELLLDLEYVGGPGRPGRPERGGDRRRQPDRGAGHRGRPGVHAPGVRWSAGLGHWRYRRG